MFKIVSPIGGFGNHLRWLLLLSNNFDISKLTNQKDKISFIKDCIYFRDRTWHNWLQIEWNYRDELDSFISLIHDKGFDTKNKTILMYANPELCYKCYLKFNSNLNNTPVEVFKKNITNYNNVIIKSAIKLQNNLVISSEKMFNEVLDEELYVSCVEFFNVENVYSKAVEIHKIWYNLHLAAEKDFIDSITKLYKAP